MSRVNEAMEDDDEDEDLTQTDEGASSWLQSIGLNSKAYKSLDPSNVKLYPFHLTFTWFQLFSWLHAIIFYLRYGNRLKNAAWLQTLLPPANDVVGR